MLHDPRAADVAEARRLFAVAAAEGTARLPALSAAELCVLCAGGQVLAEAVELRWWAGFSPARRGEVAAAVYDLLAYRGLLRPAGQNASTQQSSSGDGRWEMTPGLAVVIAARWHPALVAAGSRGDGSAAGAPRMYGLAEDGVGLRAVVAEYIDTALDTGTSRRLGPLHQFGLLSVGRAAAALAPWAFPAHETGSSGHHQIVDLYRCRPGAGPARDRITVTTTSGHPTVTRQPPIAAAAIPAPCDRESLTQLLAGMLTGELP